jgi:alkaline phosphatase D
MGELNHSAKPQQRLWNDAWDGYAAARLRLTQHLAGLRGSHPGSVPLVLGGDVHESWVGRVLADYARPDSSAVGVELCGTSISSHSSHTAEQMAQRLANNPHFDWADTLHRGYTLLDLTPQGATALIRGLDDVRKAQTPVSTLARFVVEPGRAAVHRAG